MKTFKKILGGFCSIMAVISVILLIDTHNLVFIVETLLWVFFATLLFKKKKIKDSINSIELSEQNASSYIETNTMIYRSDGQEITESEIPYLQQIDREKARAKMLMPQHIRHIQESYQIMYDTDNPDTLCSRYKYTKGIVEELQYFFQQGYYTDVNNLEKYKELISDSNYKKLIVQCFTKYMNKANTELKTVSRIEKRKQKFLDYIRENVDVQILMNLSIF